MAMYTLVVSNPPHEKEVDADGAAPCFGLTAADVRMKANYGAPEIWLADKDRSKLEDAAQTLRETGLNVVVVPGKDLANIPAPATVKSFSFTDTHLVAASEDFEVELAYDAPIIAVFCKARKAREASTAELTQPDPSALLDLYASPDGDLLRISVVQDVAEFSGLGDLKLPTAADNMLTFVEECEQRFTQAQFDRRLVDVRLRRSLIADPAAKGHERRKGFSFATKILANLLEAISPDLKDISQFEVGSRLAYLTQQ